LPLRGHFGPRLTRCAGEEKDMLDACLLHVTLTNAPDNRSLLSRPLKPLCVKHIPYALQA
jgi:hypothetical protein